MTVDLDIVIAIVTAVLASSSFWLFVERRRTDKDLTRKLLIGLAHDRIVFLSEKYLERGWITHDEYENLAVFLYKPYTDLGGNGSATRLMKEVDKLRIIHYQFQPLESEGTDGNVSK